MGRFDEHRTHGRPIGYDLALDKGLKVTRLETDQKLQEAVLISYVDDHLRNYGFLWLGGAGWSLSPIYDLNPTPTDLKARVLTTNIDLDDGTCSIDLLQESAGYFGLGLSPACEIIKEVATATWRDVANEMGVRTAEINRMASAFEHDDLEQAQTL